MPQSRQSRAISLANGSRVVVTVGRSRRGLYKTVSLYRRNGTANSRTYRRALLPPELFVGSYPSRVPR